MIKRLIKQDIKLYLKHFPSILITGARQVGKSTLAMDLGVENYVTFDDISTLQSAKTDPKGFIQALGKPVIIDEVQKVPEIFVAIKEHIDNDRTAGTFILTGSSNLQGFKNISDSLAGRIGIIDLYPFSLYELFAVNDNFIDFVFADIDPSIEFKPLPIENYIINGGFPEVQTIEEEKIKYLWFSSYITTYIERDARDIGDIRNLDGFIKLYKALAYRSGNLVNKSALGNESGLTNKTLENYLAILKNTYQISMLQPYFQNELKRTIKAPKVFMNDTGVLAHLLRVTSTEALETSEYKGAIYESFIFAEILKSNSYASNKTELSFYRTNDGKEIDFILDNKHELVAVEVKSSKSVKAADFKQIKHFIEQVGTKVSKGIVMYNGNKIMTFGTHLDTTLYALPFSTFANLSRSH
ncbi:MAG: ATP-binding protein [Thermodesulfobacteriota bacterium]|nr:ATP-binding protein [Thermodesulfobacteriota bacterium]